jgi:hypothetical protein
LTSFLRLGWLLVIYQDDINDFFQRITGNFFYPAYTPFQLIVEVYCTSHLDGRARLWTIIVFVVRICQESFRDRMVVLGSSFYGEASDASFERQLSGEFS